MINAFIEPREYRTMLKQLTDDEFSELVQTIKEEYAKSIDGEDLTKFNELFYAQGLITDEVVRRSGVNDKIGFYFNAIGL